MRMVIPGQIISEEHREGASNIIPDAVLRILVTLEGCEVPFTWELRKNVDDFSLMVKLPAKLRNRQRHVGQRGSTRNSEPASSAKSTTAKYGYSTSTSVKLNPAHKAPVSRNLAQLKKKSPSTLRRDRERRKQWRKKHDPRARDNVTNIVAPSTCTSSVAVDVNPSVTDVRPSSIEKILDITTEPHSTIPKSKPDHPQQSEPIISPSHIIHRDYEETEDSESEESEDYGPYNPWWDHACPICVSDEGHSCENCGEEELTPDIVICPTCDSAMYCSKLCHAEHWSSVHVFECKGPRDEHWVSVPWPSELKGKE